MSTRGAGAQGAGGSTRVRTAWAPVLGLLLLSPVCAEYLIGYDATIGDPATLAFGLLILGPLYGVPALLLREIARRRGGGWPAILLLALAAGIVQAGLIDQSLFFLEFSADDPDWALTQGATPIPGIGVDADQLLGFVGGHVIWSFAAPIAVVEALAGPCGRAPWLGRGAILVLGVLYLLAALFVNADAAPDSAPAQLVGAAAVAAALIGLALRRGRPDPRPKPGARAPRPLLVLLVAGALLLVTQVLSGVGAWAGVAAVAAALLVLGLLVRRWSRTAGWSPRHELALAAAALLVRGGLSFLVEPLGDVDPGSKILSNAVILAAVAALLVLAARRIRVRAPGPPSSATGAASR